MPCILNAFSDKYAVISDEKYMIGVLPNSYDDFVSKSFVNHAITAPTLLSW